MSGSCQSFLSRTSLTTSSRISASGRGRQDAGEAAVPVDDGQGLEPVDVQQPGGLGGRGVRGDGDGRGGHQPAGVDGRGLGLGLRVAPQQAPQRPAVGVARLVLLLVQQVRLGDDAGDEARLVHDGQPADAVLGQHLGDLGERGPRGHRHHVPGHDVLDSAALHGLLLVLGAQGWRRAGR
jgi:hypothetical protein